MNYNIHFNKIEQTIQPLFFAGGGILLFFIPLVPFNFIYLDHSPLLSALFRFFPFVICSVLLSMWSYLYWRHKNRPYFSSLWLLIVAQLFLSLLSSLAGEEPFVSVSRLVYYSITGGILGILFGSTINSSRVLHIYLITLVSAASLVGLYGIGEMLGAFGWLRESCFTADNPLMTQFSQINTSRALATVGNPLPLGAYLCLCTPFILFCSINNRQAYKRGIALAGFGIMVVTTVLTFSRGAWLAMGVSLCVYLGRRKWPLWLFLLLGITAAVLVSQFSKRSIGRDFGSVSMRQVASSHRIQSFRIVTEIWRQQPLLGAGTRSYGRLAHERGSVNDVPDNMFLLIIAETGILGFAMHIGFFFALFKMLMAAYDYPVTPVSARDRSGSSQMAERQDQHTFPDCAHLQYNRELIRAFGATFAGFGVNLLTWDGLQFPVTRIVFWILVGAAVAHIRLFSEEISMARRELVQLSRNQGTKSGEPDGEASDSILYP